MKEDKSARGTPNMNISSALLLQHNDQYSMGCFLATFMLIIFDTGLSGYTQQADIRGLRVLRTLDGSPVLQS